MFSISLSLFISSLKTEQREAKKRDGNEKKKTRDPYPGTAAYPRKDALVGQGSGEAVLFTRSDQRGGVFRLVVDVFDGEAGGKREEEKHRRKGDEI